MAKKSLADYMKKEETPKAEAKGGDFAKMRKLHLFEKFMHPGFGGDETHLERLEKQMAAFEAFLACK